MQITHSSILFSSPSSLHSAHSLSSQAVALRDGLAYRRLLRLITYKYRILDQRIHDLPLPFLDLEPLLDRAHVVYQQSDRLREGDFGATYKGSVATYNAIPYASQR